MKNNKFIDDGVGLKIIKADSKNEAVPQLKSFADKAGVSLEKAEEKWKEAKELADKDKKVTKDSDQYWALVSYLTKKLLGVNESMTDSVQDILKIFKLKELDK